MNKVGAYAWWVSWTLTLLIASSFGLAAAGFTMGLPLTTAVAMGGAVLTVVLLRRATKDAPSSGQVCGWAAVAGIAALLIVASVSIARKCDDASGDGHWFHQEALIQLADNWNPFYFDPDLQVNQSDLPETQRIGLWLGSYPKALWIASSLVYMTTGDLEAGKAIHWLLGCAAMGAALWVFLDLGVPWLAAMGLSLVAAFTPVVITQLYSYYLDGDLHCLIVIVLAGGYRLLRAREWSTGVFLAAGIVLLVNSKLLGVAYAGLAGAALGAWAVLRNRRALAWTIGIFAIAAPVGMLWFGYSPYVRNQREHGHLLFPAMGPQRIFDDVLGPRDFPKLNRAEDLFTTLYSKPEVFPVYSGTTRWKGLFRVDADDLVQFRHWPDVAVNGYGVLFGEALAIALVLLLTLMWRPKSWWHAGAVVFAIAVIIGATLIKEFAWYARYNPQVSLIPVIVAAAAFGGAGGWMGRVRRWLAYAVTLLLVLNSLLIARAYFMGQLELTQHFRRQVRAAADASLEKPVTVSFRHLRSFRIYWEKAGVRFHEVRRRDQLPCQKPVTIDMMHAVWCPPDKPQN